MRLLILSFVFAVAALAQSPGGFEAKLDAGEAALQRSRYTEASTQLHRALSLLPAADGAGQAALPTRAVELFSTLCDLDLMMGQFDEAVSLATRASDTVGARVAQGLAKAADQTPHLDRLAGAARAAGKTDMAINILQKMLAIDQTAGADDPKVALDYDKIGGVFMETKQYDDARKAYRSGLDSRTRRLGGDHVDIATNWVNLGAVDQRDKNYAASRTEFETALAMSERLLGTENYGLTGILDRLGSLFNDQKMFGDAETVLQRSLAIREKVLGPRHSDVAPALDSLATVYFFDDKYLEAEPLFQRGLQIWIATKGPSSPLVADSLDSIGAVYSAQKRYAEAEPYFRKALWIREMHDIESLGNLALLYDATNDHKRAEEYFLRAILTGEKGLGGDHPEVLDKMVEYATMLQNAGRVLEAKKVEARAKDLKEKLAAQVPGAAPVAESKPKPSVEIKGMTPVQKR